MNPGAHKWDSDIPGTDPTLGLSVSSPKSLVKVNEFKIEQIQASSLFWAYAGSYEAKI